jgi:hypothetical protein
MEKELKEHLITIAANETNKDLQFGMLLMITHMEAYLTGEYITFSEICTQMYQKQQELCLK